MTMRIDPLSIEGAYAVTPVVHGDDRGMFTEAFRHDHLAAATGRTFPVEQTNTSVSAAGVVRGVHFADVPPGQAKYVTCASGAVLDVVVDVRVGSPTFGRHETVLLDARTPRSPRRAVLVSEGIGHAFVSLTDGAVVTYLCTAVYRPGHEHGVDPLDPALGIAWPDVDLDGAPLVHQTSDKDTSAPSLADALAAGMLPAYADCRAWIDTLRP